MRRNRRREETSWREMKRKESLTWVKAEHSTYLTAFNSFANFSPCSYVMGFCLFFANFSTVAASSLRSIWVPTNRNGVFWQWCVISGTHWEGRRIRSNSWWKEGTNLFFNVLKRGWRHDRKTNEKHIRLRIRKGPQPIIVLLSCCIKESKSVWLTTDHDSDSIVVKDLSTKSVSLGGSQRVTHRWNVLRREFVGCVRNQETCLTNSTVTNNDTFDRLHLRCKPWIRSNLSYK